MAPDSHLAWVVPFEAGTLVAHGFRSGRRVATTTVSTTGVPKRIVADSEGMAVTLHVADADGLFVPTADNLMRFEIKGPGRLIGVGNGDPSSHDSDKAAQRRLFNGKCLALVEPTELGGKIEVIVRSKGLDAARVTLPVSRVAPPRV
jgi:beta-galactosidase